MQEAAEDMKNCMEQNAGRNVGGKPASKPPFQKSRTPRSRKSKKRNASPKREPITPRKLFQESGEEESQASGSPQRMILDQFPEGGARVNLDDCSEDEDLFQGVYALKDKGEEVETPTKSKSKRKRSRRSSPKVKKEQCKPAPQEEPPTAPEPILSPDLLSLIPESMNKTL